MRSEARFRDPCEGGRLESGPITGSQAAFPPVLGHDEIVTDTGAPAQSRGNNIRALWHGPRCVLGPLARLAPAYSPRRPEQSALHGIVREHLASFLAHADEHHEGGLPKYVEHEFRAYLKCGIFAHGTIGSDSKMAR